MDNTLKGQKKIKIIKVDANGVNPNDKFVYLDDGESIFDYDDKIILENHNFSKNHKILKVKSGDISIYRMAISGNAKWIKKDEVGITPRDKSLLGIKDNDANLSIEKTNTFMFCWKYPISVVRISFKISLMSVLLGLISILVAVVSR
ncbi:MAG: hypothetical protein LBO69_01415 [Ignavibacteria bacterium]|nr:hypothetical protein [Ignavibacteria bacterium]